MTEEIDPRLLKGVSKFLSFVLRHKPEAIGLELDAEGWANIDDIIARMERPVARDVILEVVRQNDKQRFALSADGQDIRANQGHSISVDLGLDPVRPPDVLFHGTATRFLDAILDQGVLPKNRQYVHLSADRETALKVGQRHGKPVVLEVRAEAMFEGGQMFYQAKNGVWLTGPVQPEFLEKTP